MRFHGDLTLEEFWLQWFGLFGREIGSKPPYPAFRKFSENPNDLINAIKFCEENKIPIWITAQPFSAYGAPMGIEKLFVDFDDEGKYCPECDKWYHKDDVKHLSKVDKKQICKKHKCDVIVKPRKDMIGKLVKRFLRKNIPEGVIPLVVETFKGYHIYISLRRIFTFRSRNIEFVKKVYINLVERFIGQEDPSVDSMVKHDIKRFARVPLTIHERWGKRCRIVRLKGEELVEDKVRSVAYYRQRGITDTYVKKAILAIKKELEIKAELEKKRINDVSEDILYPKNGNRYQQVIRPCFQIRLDAGEMTHGMRLAFLIEAYFNGYKGITEKESEDKLTNLFRENMNDFVEGKTRYFVRYFLEHEPDVYPPYKCETLQEKGFCVESECPIWRKKKGKL